MENAVGTAQRRNWTIKRVYKRKCWYITDKWICEGYTDKYGFHLSENGWDDEAYKSSWKVKKKDCFYNYNKAVKTFEEMYGYKMLLQYFDDAIASLLYNWFFAANIIGRM